MVSDGCIYCNQRLNFGHCGQKGPPLSNKWGGSLRAKKNYIESPEECSGLRGIVLVEREVEAIRKRPLIMLILLGEKVLKCSRTSLIVIFLSKN